MRLIRNRRLADLEAAELTVPVLRRELTKQAEKHDGELAQLGRQLADRDDTIAGLHEQLRAAGEDSVKKTNAAAHSRAVLAEVHRTHAEALRNENRGLRKALADHADRLAELTTANQDRDARGVSLVKRGPA